MSKTKDLLEFGYLPLQSPPCFSSQSFADRVVPIRKAFNKAKNSKTLGEYSSGTRPQHFSVARSRHSRRPISIPNPFAQLEIADAIAADWRAIERHCKTSSLSLSTPSFSNADGRAIHITPHTALYEKRLQFSAEARYVLTSDISQFFPSLYTHSIPWALHGKAKAKSQRFNAKLLGNRIDKALQAAQHGQTIGIPIGPDSSHIVAEIVACAIDSQLEKHLHKKILGYRHVDDFVLFFKSLGEAEEALTALEASVRYFELKLNPLKTRILGTEQFFDDSWSHELHNFSFSPTAAVQRRQIHQFLERAYQIFSESKDEAVIRFALKRLSTVIVKKPNWDTLEAHLLRCAVAFPSTLQDVALLLFTYNSIGFGPDKARMARALQVLVTEHIPLEHHSEVAWALWLALHFKIELELNLTREIALRSGSYSLLLLLKLSDLGLLAPKFDKRWLRPFCRPETLYDDSWLLTYEADRNGWLPAKRGPAEDDALFKVLRTQQVRFFLPDAVPSPLFEPKPGFDRSRLDGDADVSREFDYDERASSYQGSEVLEEIDEDEGLSEVDMRDLSIDDEDSPF